ncbi:carboxypeptidase-like regulatory domain-containing protein, partial [Methanospirillum hungatei]|uniref:carboxypeptidase-like regulatory domain-containing protein n=1 Tax=Methanospirillum hungatei TaxID=2203 RepID=UPI0026EB91CC
VQTTGLSGYVPAESPVPASPASGPVIAASTQAPAPASDLPKITSMTLSANNLRPTVGTDVELTGRLVDSSGKGVPGVSITIEVPDYGTDFLPLLTTSTDGDGRFSATISTWEGGGVPVRAVFEGNDKYLACTSNTLTFYASDKKSTGSLAGGVN